MSSDSAVSELIGAILLVSLVILGVMIVAVSVLSQPPPEDVPQVNALADNVSKTVYLYHDGGNSLEPQEIRTIVNGQDSTFSLANNESYPWSVGKTLKVDYTGPGMPEYIQLIYTGGSTQTLILTASFVPPSVTGGPTTLPTTSTTTIPTTIVTTIPTICPTPQAIFSGSPLSGIVPLSVLFTDTSTSSSPIINRIWNFGDGAIVSTTQQTITHTYNLAGAYTVSLTVENQCGSSNTSTKTSYISATCSSSSVDADRVYPRCGTSCQVLTNGTCQVSLGYFNDNAYCVYIPIFVPVGFSKNEFTTGLQDRGQPEIFDPGTHLNVFTVFFTDNNVKWKLGGTGPDHMLDLSCHNGVCSCTDP
jgi:FOG: PKD repeat